MRLLIDIGNSALKWRLIKAPNQTLAQSQIWLTDWDVKALSQAWLSFSQDMMIHTMWVASVSSPHYVQQLKDWASEQNVQYQQVSTQARVKVGARQLINGYANPSQLGVDRWLAMLAVMACTDPLQNFCLIDCGSATTVDYVIQDSVTQTGQHLGGYIMPGEYLMAQSLVVATEQIQMQSETDSQHFPTHTSAAVLSGTAYMHINTMQALIHEAIAQGYQVYVTGGGRYSLAKALDQTDNEVVFCADLVLDGLGQSVADILTN